MVDIAHGNLTHASLETPNQGWGIIHHSCGAEEKGWTESREQKSQMTTVHIGMTSQVWKFSGREEKGNQKLARNSIPQNIT